MKKLCYFSLFSLALLMSPVFSTLAISDAQVQVNIGLPLPPLMFPAPPPLLAIPGAYVYYPPDVDVDIFFHHDSWYRPHAGKWYWAKHYNGPWHIINDSHVPRAVFGILPSFRSVTPHYEKVSFDKVKRYHWEWEKNRHWDQDKSQKNQKGENHKYGNDRKDGHLKNNDQKHGHHK